MAQAGVACRTPVGPASVAASDHAQRGDSPGRHAASRRQASEVSEAEPEAIFDEPSSENALDRTLTAVATEQALSVLGPDERRLIRLRYVEDLTQGQVAAALGVPEGTVKVRLHRARARLRGVAGDLAA